jgi:superfamily II DNA or RNA helicase
MDNDPNAVIEEFAKSNERWIVSVKMVSEGVDIPRAIVGVYASDVKTEMWFRQVVGRHVRKMDGDLGQTAKLFIPDHAELREIADRIQDEANVPIHEQELEIWDGLLPESTTETFMANFLASSEAVTSCVIYDGQTVDGSEIRQAQEVIRRTGLVHLEVTDVASIIRSMNNVGADTNFQLVSQSSITQKTITPDDQRNQLKNKIRDKVGKLARLRGGDSGEMFKEINADLVREFGVKRAEADIECLEMQLARVKEWINQTDKLKKGKHHVS